MAGIKTRTPLDNETADESDDVGNSNEVKSTKRNRALWNASRTKFCGTRE